MHRGLLQSLCEYSRQIGLPPPMYRDVVVRYVVHLDVNGRFLFLTDTVGEDQKKGMHILAPDCRRSTNIKPKLFADRLDYTFGQTIPPTLDDKVVQRFAAYVECVRACAEETKEPSVIAILRYLSDSTLEPPPLPVAFDPTGRITFSVVGVLPIELPSVQAFWKRVAAVGEKELVMQCLVCGQNRPPVRRLAVAIQGIPQGQATGMALISMNEPAFQSYGLEASLNAPTCEECGLSFSAALNTLLKHPDTHMRIGSIIYIFWSSQPMPLSLGKLMGESDAVVIKQALLSPIRGESDRTVLDTTPYYAVGLSANVSRVVVRDWTATTLSVIKGHLQYYFCLQQVVNRVGQPAFFPLWQLVNATTSEGADAASPIIQPALLAFALRGVPLPMHLLSQVLRILRVQRQVKPSQASLLKMALLSQRDISWIGYPIDERPPSDQIAERDGLLVALDSSCNDPAYLSGRLFATMEAIQYAALGQTSSNVVTRYYSMASTRPAAAFASMLRGSQAHLAKLRRDKRGAYVRLQKQLQTLIDMFPEVIFPEALEVMQQARFHLGYYQQLSEDRRALLAVLEKRQSATTNSDLGSAEPASSETNAEAMIYGTNTEDGEQSM